jgi:hypothetical protein
MKIGFIKHQYAGNTLWEGALRDDKGGVVWHCGHEHDCRDSNNHRWFAHKGSARKCAREELARRNSQPSN